MDRPGEKPPIKRGAVQIPSTSERVIDADEEVFILYSELQASSLQSDYQGFRGLGHVDSRKDIMTITFELNRPKPDIATKAATEPIQKRKSRKNKNKPPEDQRKTIEIKVSQDKTALRTRKGDTGSVLWRASIDFAQVVLQQFYEASTTSLLDKQTLAAQHVIELGAGTGFLPIAFAPFVDRYTATDIEDLVPLLRKNVVSNFNGWPDCARPTPGSNVFIEQLDWLLLHATIPASRSRLCNFDPADLILVVDCIYHPSLLPALVETIDHLTVSDRTAVLVVMELRAVEVTREFLDLWISRSVGWEIWRIDGMLQRPYAMWLGWRRDHTEASKAEIEC